VNGHATISLAVNSRAPKPLDVRIRLRYESPRSRIEIIGFARAI
jgi:hypothetical protein